MRDPRRVCSCGSVRTHPRADERPYLRHRLRGDVDGRVRWDVERTFAHLHNFERLLVRYERRGDMHDALLALGCCLTCFRRLTTSM